MVYVYIYTCIGLQLNWTDFFPQETYQYIKDFLSLSVELYVNINFHNSAQHLYIGTF